MVLSLAIGGGLRVLPEERSRIDLRLDEVVPFSSGVLLLVHRPA